MIAIVDYGVGNLFSLKSSFACVGAQAEVTREASALRRASKIVLPGVGAFADAAKKLKESGLQEAFCEEARAGKPVLGICLGMQLLFEESLEYGVPPGLGLLKGRVEPIAPAVGKGYKVPHIGWNVLNFPKERPKAPIFADVSEGDYVYFVHSYYAAHCEDSLAATTDYGAPLTAAVWQGSLFATQFHPEKSGEVGLKILRAFARL